MTKTVPMTVSVRALVKKGDKYLFGLHNHIKPHWETPGGRLAEGEDVVEALKREVLEEVGAGCKIVGEPIFVSMTRGDITEVLKSLGQDEEARAPSLHILFPVELTTPIMSLPASEPLDDFRYMSPGEALKESMALDGKIMELLREEPKK